MAEQPVKGPASYFPSIEKKYGRPIAEWKALVRANYPAKHMELVAMLKEQHGTGPRPRKRRRRPHIGRG